MTKLVCIDTKPVRAESGIKLPLTLGQEYELLDVHKCKVLRFDVGVLHPKAAIIDRLYCATCKESFNDMHVYFYAWRFIKLDPDFKLEDEPTAEQERQTNKRLRHAFNYGVGPEVFKDILIHQGNTK